MDTLLPHAKGGFRLVYRGDSMEGVFREGDCLQVRPVPYESLRPGDVAAMSSGDGRRVVHRIIGAVPGGWRTRGDACLAPDSDVLAADRFLGRVVARERDGRILPVSGGMAGRVRSLVFRFLFRFRRGLLFPLAPLYRLIRSRRWAARVWKPRIQILQLEGTAGGIRKYLHRGRTVALWFPANHRWQCRKPYDLILERPPR